MPARLVAPDRVVYVIATYDEEALRRIVLRYEPNQRRQAELAKNLRQLLDWTDVGLDRDGRDETANFQLLSKIWCLQHDVSREIVAVVGKYSHIWKTVVDPHPEMLFSNTSMKKLINGSVPHKMGWRRRRAPAAWMQLADGTSLAGLGEHPTPPTATPNAPPPTLLPTTWPPTAVPPTAVPPIAPPTALPAASPITWSDLPAIAPPIALPHATMGFGFDFGVTGSQVWVSNVGGLWVDSSHARGRARWRSRAISRRLRRSGGAQLTLGARHTQVPSIGAAGAALGGVGLDGARVSVCVGLW